MTKQFSINSNFYFSRRCQEAVRVSGPSEEGWQLEIIVSPLLEVLSVNAWLQQLSPQGSRDVKKPSRHRNGLAIAPGHLTKGPASLRGWLVANRFYSPVPVSFTVCGLLLAVSFTFKVAVRVPVACGVNFTERVHLPLAATLLPQVLVWAKSLGSVPVKLMPLMVSAVDKSLVKVTV